MSNTKHTPKNNLVDLLRSNVIDWFESLNSGVADALAEHYTDETGDYTDLTNGLNKDSVIWIADNYGFEIKEFICSKYPDLLKENEELRAKVYVDKMNLSNAAKYLEQVTKERDELKEKLTAIEALIITNIEQVLGI